MVSDRPWYGRLRLSPLIAFAPLSVMWFILLSWPLNILLGGLWLFIGLVSGTGALRILLRGEDE